jgi:hypothetical protein
MMTIKSQGRSFTRTQDDHNQELRRKVHENMVTQNEND